MLLLNLRRRNKNKYTHKLIYEGGITKETFDLMRSNPYRRFEMNGNVQTKNGGTVNPSASLLGWQLPLHKGALTQKARGLTHGL